MGRVGLNTYSPYLWDSPHLHVSCNVSHSRSVLILSPEIPCNRVVVVENDRKDFERSARDACDVASILELNNKMISLDTQPIQDGCKKPARDLRREGALPRLALFWLESAPSQDRAFLVEILCGPIVSLESLINIPPKPKVRQRTKCMGAHRR